MPVKDQKEIVEINTFPIGHEAKKIAAAKVAKFKTAVMQWVNSQITTI